MRMRWIALAGLAIAVLGGDLAAAEIDAPSPGTPPSRFGKLTSRRWAFGVPYARENLAPVPNPNPSPEPQPRRDHPFDVAISGDGTKVYIALQGSELEPGSEIAVYDVDQERIVKRIPLKMAASAEPAGTSPFRMAVHPDGRYLIVTCRFSNFACVIDTRSDAVVTEIPLDFYCQSIAFDRKGRTAYITNRYLDQVFVLDVDATGDTFSASLREVGGLDYDQFAHGVFPGLRRSCGASGCHGQSRGGFVAGTDVEASFISALSHVHPGDALGSRLLGATVSTEHGGYADKKPLFLSHAQGTVVFANPEANADYRALQAWIDTAAEGPGIPVGNPRSKPKSCALSTDGRHLFVANTGTQDISIINTRTQREVGAIYIQNAVNDLKIYTSPETGRDYLLVATEGIGFGVLGERDPYGGESWDPANPATQYSLWRDLATGGVLPKDEQETLGPFDAVDGTAAIKFRDIQNDMVLVDTSTLVIPETPSADGPSYLLLANRYESHRGWVRYTSDTAESTYGDIKGDIPPDLMRVEGAFPEKMVLVGDRLFVTMQGSNQVQEWRINPTASDPSDFLLPGTVYDTGLQPIGIAAGPDGTLYVANFLGGSISIIDPDNGTSRDVIVDPSVQRLPVPATNAERGEVFAHTSVFSSDGDTSCFHCHYLDMGDGRPWGVSQVASQEFFDPDGTRGQLVIAGTMAVPQMRGLFQIQPFFLEGVISAFEPRSMIMEHNPSDDFNAPIPYGDFTGIEAHYPLTGLADIQSQSDTSAKIQSSLEERRDEMFRTLSMRLFGKAFVLRDFQRFVGEWQISEPRLLPNPFDSDNQSVQRGKQVFEHPQVGCVSCHPSPHFAKKDLADNPEQSFAPLVTFSVRDGSFTLIGMNRLDYINGITRDLEPWDIGRAEEEQGRITSTQLRGLWDRPPVFLHNGMARTLNEVVCTPGHPSLRKFKYPVLLGGQSERPLNMEVGLNMSWLYKTPSEQVKLHMQVGSRLGFDTHGGVSHLTATQVDDLVNFLHTIE